MSLHPPRRLRPCAAQNRCLLSSADVFLFVLRGDKFNRLYGGLTKADLDFTDYAVAERSKDVRGAEHQALIAKRKDISCSKGCFRLSGEDTGLLIAHSGRGINTYV